jgi:hypothetical protein
MLLETLYVAVSIVLLSVVIFRIRLLQRARRDPAFLCYCTGIALGVPYLLLRVPAIHRSVGQLLGITNVAQPIALYIVMVACFLIRPLLERLTTPSAAATPTRGTAALLLIALATMAATFAPIRVNDDSTWFALRNETAPFVLEYQILYSIWMVIAQLAFAVPSWRYGRLSSDPCVRLGFQILVPIGVAFSQAALFSDLAFGAAARFGFSYPAVDPVGVFSTFTLLCFLALCVGSTMPAWGHLAGIPSLDRFLRRYILYQRLYPLWSKVYAPSPWIALLPPRSRLRDTLAIGDLEFRFYRRVVEILDGRLALRAFTVDGVAEAVRAVCNESAVPDLEREFITAAASLTLATHAKLRNEMSHSPSLPAIPISRDIYGEAQALARVAHYCADAALMSRIGERVQCELAKSVRQVGAA